MTIINKRILSTALIALVLVSLFSLTPAAAVAKTITVGSGGSYTTIQSAINAAAAGDTIVVNSGTYSESITVNKNIILQGSSGPVISPGAKNAITVTASGATVQGFTIKGAKHGILVSSVSNVVVKGNTITGGSGDGIRLTSANYCTVSGNTLNTNYFGIEMFDSKGTTISGNTLSTNHEIDIYMERVSDGTVKGNSVGANTGASNQGGDGIGMRYGTNMLIDSNTVGKHYYGIKVYYSNKTTVSNNIAKDSGCNIRFDFNTVDSVARGNTVSNGIEGILINSTASRITIEGNKLFDNRQAVYILNCNNHVIQGNTAYGNTYGVRAQGTSGNKIIGNDFVDNTYGVYLSGSNNQVYLNDLKSVSSSGTGNVYSSPAAVSYKYNGVSYSSKLGNYWTSYSGTDSDKNGVGGTSYSNGGAADSYPLMAKHTNYVTSANPIPTATPTATPKPTVTPTATPKPTVTPTATPTATPKPTVTPVPTAAPTPTPGTPAYAVDNMRTMAHYNGDTKRMEQLTVTAGTTLTQDVYFKNVGSGADTYMVSVTGISAASYKVNLYESTTVEPNDFRAGYVAFTPTTPGTYRVNIQVKSVAHPDVQDTVNYVLTVK